MPGWMETSPTHPSFARLLRVFARIGLISFGGPAGQIALMHRVLVDEERWIDERSYLNALNFCMLLPGPEAMQLATYVGWRLHGTAGGLAAGLLFVIPGALVVLALSMIYAAFGNVPLVSALFLGIKAAVLAIVMEALLRISRRSLRDGVEWLIAALAFIGVFFFSVPFPVIVLAAALIGFVRGGVPAKAAVAPVSVASSARPALTGTLLTTLIWLAIWGLPLGVLALLFGSQHVITQIAVFFSKLAVVTFGGAYAVLAYMVQDVAGRYGWLTSGEMLDGLGLAETTPGPLILVTEFVGFLAAYRAGGWGLGLLGALVTLWATFAPCFLWIFAGAPYVEHLNRAPRLSAALAGVTAAVVGVILNLTVWFAIHVLFAQVTEMHVGAARLLLPTLASVSWVSLALSALAVVLLFVRHTGVILTLALCAGLGALAHVARSGVIF